MPPPNLLLWYIDHFELKALEKQQMQGEAFSSLPYLPRDRSSKRSSTVNQGTLTPLTGQETRSDTTARQTLSPTITYPCGSSKGPSIFPKIIYSPLSGLHFSSPSPIKIVYKLSNPNLFRVIHFFFPVMLPGM